MQSAVAEEYGEKLREFQEVMFPAAYGDGTREWTHLVLTKVSFLLSCTDTARSNLRKCTRALT